MKQNFNKLDYFEKEEYLKKDIKELHDLAIIYTVGLLVSSITYIITTEKILLFTMGISMYYSLFFFIAKEFTLLQLRLLRGDI